MMDKVKRTMGIRLMMFYDFLTIAKPTEYLTDYNSYDEPSSRPVCKRESASDNNISGYKNILGSWRCDRARNMDVEKNILDASANTLRGNILAELYNN